MNLTPADVIASYAAFVATGVLALEVRRWFESAIRLSVNMMPEAKMTDDPTDQTYLAVFVVNRGPTPTTITHFALHEYPSAWARLRRKASWSAIVPRPAPAGQPQNIPQQLEPNAQWMGLAVYDEELMERRKRGHLYVAIHATHSDRAIMKRVPRPVEKPPNAKTIENP